MLGAASVAFHAKQLRVRVRVCVEVGDPPTYTLPSHSLGDSGAILSSGSRYASAGRTTVEFKARSGAPVGAGPAPLGTPPPSQPPCCPY